MDSENGKLFFGAGLDNSQLEQDAQHATEILSDIGKQTEEQSAAVRELLNNVPRVELDFTTNLPTTAEEIQTAFDNINSVIEQNEAALKTLEAEERRLSAEYSNTFQKSQQEADGIAKQRQPILENIRLRKEVLQEAKATQRELQATVKKMQEEGKAADDNAKQHMSLRQRLRELKMELLEMEEAGQRGTARYRELQEEAGRLTDAWGDAQAQANILANDNRGLQGVMSGLQGVAGAATVATGVMGLYGGENEHLQQIMLKVQSLMAITMGLQQLSNTLNKDSAFQLVTLNGLKELWNKITGESNQALEEETANTAANTTTQEANAAATTLNTTATTANAASKKAKTGATVAGTTAEVAGTAATTAHTAATVAQTIATKAATVAMKGLKAAIMATGIGALIVLVGELVGWLVSLFDTTDEAEEKQKELNEVLAKGREAYAKATVEISDYKDKIDRFNGTKAEEKRLVEELNKKYGEAMGYYKSLEEWKIALVEKGEAYCNMLLKEAEAQAILSKYTEAYIALQEVRDKKASEFGNMLTTDAGDRERKRKAVEEAEDEMNIWLSRYKNTLAEAQQLRDSYDLNPHIDPTTVKPVGGSGKTFDPAKAALETKKAIEEYNKAVKEYIKDSSDEMNALTIETMQQGLAKELAQIRRDTRQKLVAWNNQIYQLAEARKAAAKAQYMNTKGATEVGWANSDDGKKSLHDWILVIQQETPAVIEQYNKVWQQITDNGEAAIQRAQQAYTDALIDEFGTFRQKEEKLTREWAAKLAYIPDEFKDQAMKQMEEAFAALNSEKFKAGINWESVFGNLSEQAVPVLQHTLARVRQYFEENKATMSTEEIKDYQEAIANMEQEIANRNPFSALAKALQDISTSKQEMVSALAAVKAAQDEYNAAIVERNNAMAAYRDILDQIKAGQLDRNSAEVNEAFERQKKAIEGVGDAQEKLYQAENRAMNAQNKNTAAYKNAANALKNVGSVVSNLGKRAESLAEVFDDDVARSIKKSVNFMDEVVDATSTVINAIGDLGKGVAKGIEATVDAAAQGATASATAGAAAISTIEKASAILAIISAAIQVATAIANMFNDDDSKQEEIEHLQDRIDQLQWELDHQDILRMEERVGSSVERVRTVIEETWKELMHERIETKDWYGVMRLWFGGLANDQEALRKGAQKLADAYANMSYTVDKALGANKFADSRAQLENIAQQQILIQQQIEDEYDKKDTDHGQIDEWNRKIEELGQQAVALINELVEDIIGGSSTEIANQLADAFFEAFEAGEDAAEAWGNKVDDIVKDITKRMLVSKFLEEPLGEIFNKYKAKWFPNGVGNNTIDLVLDSMGDFANDLKAQGQAFNDIFNALPEDVRNMFMGEVEATRQAQEKGIATASQESVDELNGRATTIQSHTYAIAEGTRILQQNSAQILQSVLNIEGHTEKTQEKVEQMEGDLRELKDTVNDITLRGIKIKS